MAQPQPGGILQPQDQAQPQQPINQTIPRSPYPAPPPFWKHFTAQNIQRLKEAESSEDFDATELPYELAVLRPPQPPTTTDQQYTTFGISHHVLPRPTLPIPPPEQPEGLLLFNPEDLAQSNNTSTARPHARLLSRLTKSLLLNFLELTSIMAENPRGHSSTGDTAENPPQQYWSEKINDISVLNENIAAVINLLRPHQARESVKTMLEKRLEAGRQEMEQAEQVKAKVEAFLQEVGKNGNRKVEDDGMDVDEVGVNGHKVNGNGAHINGAKEKEADIEEVRRLWAMLDDIDGD